MSQFIQRESEVSQVSTPYEARLLREEEYNGWNRLVSESPGGTVYQQSWWLQTLARHCGARVEIIGCFRGNALCGGCAAYVTKLGSLQRVVQPPTAAYNGMLVQPLGTANCHDQVRHSLNVTGTLAACLERRYSEVLLAHGPELSDVRSLIGRGWSAELRYTYEIPTGTLDDVLGRADPSRRGFVERAKRHGIRIEESDDIEAFLPLYRLAYHGIGRETPIPLAAVAELYEVSRQHRAARLYLARLPSGQAVSGLIVLNSAQTCGWLLATDPDYHRYGVAVWIMLAGVADCGPQARHVDVSMANQKNLHVVAIRNGGHLKVIPYTRFASSAVVSLAHMMARLFRHGR